MKLENAEKVQCQVTSIYGINFTYNIFFNLLGIISSVPSTRRVASRRTRTLRNRQNSALRRVVRKARAFT